MASDRFRFFASAIPFYDHPFVREKRCVRKPGVGFEYVGRRLVGITEFLRRAYFPVFKATRRGGAKKGGPARNRGLRMGCIADHAITAYVKTGNARKMAHSPPARRLAAFLQQNKLKIVDAHVLICEPNYGIATEIDVLCQGVNGLVVIENKTTLQTRGEHERTYHQADRECPLLLRSLRTLLNNEYNHHQLQLACMIIILRNTYNIRATGHVLVASSDGLNHYPMNALILNQVATSLCTMHHFNPPRLISEKKNPVLGYCFRPYISQRPDIPETLPLQIERFIKKNAPDADVKYNYGVGKLTFHERTDVELELKVDVFVESETSIFMFNCFQTDLDSKTCSLSTLPNLPSGQSNSLLSNSMLEIAIAGKVLQPKKKLFLRVHFTPSKGKPFMRLVPVSYRTSLK